MNCANDCLRWIDPPPPRPRCWRRRSWRQQRTVRCTKAATLNCFGVTWTNAHRRIGLRWPGLCWGVKAERTVIHPGRDLHRKRPFCLQVADAVALDALQPPFLADYRQPLQAGHGEVLQPFGPVGQFSVPRLVALLDALPPELVLQGRAPGEEAQGK